MARIRSIKPEIASDAKLAKLPADVRWTFLLCISQADDCGLLPGRPRALAGLLYPNSDDVTEARLQKWVQQLIAVEMLSPLASADASVLLHVVNWERHQSVDKPHFSVLSRSLIRDSVANNSRMSREQFALYAGRIREAVAEYGSNHSRQDRGPWTVDRGVTATAVSVEVLHHTPRDIDTTASSAHTHLGAS
jgi:hypothetical protein